MAEGIGDTFSAEIWLEIVEAIEKPLSGDRRAVEP